MIVMLFYFVLLDKIFNKLTCQLENINLNKLQKLRYRRELSNNDE